MTMDQKDNNTPAARLPLYMNVEFRRSYARQPEHGKLKNISLTGAFLETQDLDFVPNDKIVLTLNVSGRERKLTAHVIWKGEEGCGLAFRPVNNRDVQIVDDLMYFVENKRETRRSVLSDIFNKVS
ncbi:MAG: PilZ domain-containing protein [Bdellovibrionales bacterium]|nr:PilZ domain-containing protein [Bdellovibrionales bacterium]